MRPAFEIVNAPGGARLARARGDGSLPATPVRLAARAPGRGPRLRPPPGPPANGGWQVACALPAQIGPGASFALELADGTLTELPAPSARRVGRTLEELSAA